AFTMSADYVGGPDLGWVRTSTLEETCKPALRRDVTVQAAMAVSGAAIASAMGRHAAAVQRQLALSNVRLGTWLPNPAFLAAPGPPKVSWPPPPPAQRPPPPLPAARDHRRLPRRGPHAALHRRRPLGEPGPGRAAPPSLQDRLLHRRQLPLAPVA